VLGAVGARAGGSALLKPTLRVTFWGAFAMAATAVIGALVGRAVLMTTVARLMPLPDCPLLLPSVPQAPRAKIGWVCTS
jgi:hypothetical protein